MSKHGNFGRFIFRPFGKCKDFEFCDQWFSIKRVYIRKAGKDMDPLSESFEYSNRKIIVNGITIGPLDITKDDLLNEEERKCLAQRMEKSEQEQSTKKYQEDI
jgi:hypothetical protein